MQLNSEQLIQLSEMASAAARKAGALIADYANREVEVSHKEGADSLASQVVTEVDHLAQSVILEELACSSKEYDIALLTEELKDDGSRHRKDYFWCIDPMDGTFPFTRGIPGYAVAIALVAADGTPVVGTVFDPVEERLYEAVRHQGVRIDGKPWRVPGGKPRLATQLRFFCDCTFEEDPNRERRTAQMKAFAADQGYAGGNVIIGGGAVLNACQVLENPPAIYFKKPKPEPGGGSFWDFAATACLFEEAGAHVSDFFGQPLQLNDATHSFFNHCGVCFTTDPTLVAPLTENFK